MVVFYEIHIIFDVMQKVVKFIAQVYTIQNFAKFLQQSIETQCTDEKISTVFFKNPPQKVPTCFCFSSWWFYTYCQCNRSTLDMVQSVVLVPVFISIKNTLDFDGCNAIRSTKINLNNLLWKFIDVFKEPLLRRYLPLALDIHPKTPVIH